MQPFNEKSKAHRTRVAEIIMSLASKDDGVLWEDIVGAVRAEFTVSNWIRIREVMQFLLNKGLIKRTDNIHEERLVKAAVGKSEGEFTLLLADSDGSDATEVVSGSAEEIRSYIRRFGVPTHLCYVVDNKTGKLALDFKWSEHARGMVDKTADHDVSDDIKALEEEIADITSQINGNAQAGPDWLNVTRDRYSGMQLNLRNKRADLKDKLKELKTKKMADKKPAKGAADKVAADHDRMGVLYRLGKAGFKGKFKTGEEYGVFNYRGIPVELRLGNENLYLTLPDIYSKDSHGDIIDALAQFLSKVLDSGGAGKTRR